MADERHSSFEREVHMAKYWELRPFYHQPYQQRAALVRREMLMVLMPMLNFVDQLAVVEVSTIQVTFGPRCEELVEIAHETVHNLQQSVEELPLDGHTIQDGEQLRTLRHDLRGKVGTLLGAVKILGRHPVQGLLADLVYQLIAAANESRDIIDALLEDQERGSHT